MKEVNINSPEIDTTKTSIEKPTPPTQQSSRRQTQAIRRVTWDGYGVCQIHILITFEDFEAVRLPKSYHPSLHKPLSYLDRIDYSKTSTQHNHQRTPVTLDDGITAIAVNADIA